MSDDTITKAEYDKLASQLATLTERLETTEAKNAGLLDDLKKAQRELRSAKDITPEAHQAEVDRADKAEAALAELSKQVKALSGERDKAVKALTDEQTAARSFALAAEVRGAMNKANILPDAAEAIEAFLRSGVSVDVDGQGQFVVKRGDKPLSEFAEEYFSSDASKWARAAPANSGGGAPGGGGTGSGKAITREQFNAMNAKDRSQFFADGGAISEAA